MFIAQMSGYPGSGKSTLAKQIAKRMEVIVVDKDIMKTCMLQANVDNGVASKVAYDIAYMLCDYYLELGKSVIMDSPCYHDENLKNGMNLARKHNAKYKYIECEIKDYDIINNRLETREAMLSQATFVSTKEAFLDSFDRIKRPENIDACIVDATLPYEQFVDKVIKYLEDN